MSQCQAVQAYHAVLAYHAVPTWKFMNRPRIALRECRPNVPSMPAAVGIDGASEPPVKRFRLSEAVVERGAGRAPSASCRFLEDSSEAFQ